jgi:hypothetical protein
MKLTIARPPQRKSITEREEAAPNEDCRSQPFQKSSHGAILLMRHPSAGAARTTTPPARYGCWCPRAAATAQGDERPQHRAQGCDGVVFEKAFLHTSPLHPADKAQSAFQGSLLSDTGCKEVLKRGAALKRLCRDAINQPQRGPTSQITWPKEVLVIVRQTIVGKAPARWIEAAVETRLGTPG